MLTTGLNVDGQAALPTGSGTSDPPKPSATTASTATPSMQQSEIRRILLAGATTQVMDFVFSNMSEEGRQRYANGVDAVVEAAFHSTADQTKCTKTALALMKKTMWKMGIIRNAADQTTPLPGASSASSFASTAVNPSSSSLSSTSSSLLPAYKSVRHPIPSIPLSLHKTELDKLKEAIFDGDLSEVSIMMDEVSE
ncbi:hypothetical protein HDU79_011380 [Rhizoclosmatium sp. JEL0117]|nr:hypothetical protein HDU79_011380 [Rhizoclosmatium sp. JEL0117]